MISSNPNGATPELTTDKSRLFDRIRVVVSLRGLARKISDVYVCSAHRFILLDGYGIRLTERLSLRPGAIDLENGMIPIQNSEGGHDRYAPIPKTLIKQRQEHLARLKLLWQPQRKNNQAPVSIPVEAHNTRMDAETSWNWFLLSPSRVFSTQPETGRRLRHHLLVSKAQRIFKKIRLKLGIIKDIGPRHFQYSFASHPHDSRVQIRKTQKFLSHQSLNISMIYTSISKKIASMTPLPLDQLPSPSREIPKWLNTEKTNNKKMNTKLNNRHAVFATGTAHASFTPTINN